MGIYRIDIQVGELHVDNAVAQILEAAGELARDFDRDGRVSKYEIVVRERTGAEECTLAVHQRLMPNYNLQRSE